MNLRLWRLAMVQMVLVLAMVMRSERTAAQASGSSSSICRV
jgi:hypothetical protein